MELKNSFTVSADVRSAWAILLDVPRIAPCMPGAELTETVDATHFKGSAKLRVGPVALSFAGEAEIKDIDEAAHSARVSARGNDTKGRGAAQADVVFVMTEDNGQTRVDITTDLNLTGAVAQYGRASGLVDAIAGQIIADFAKNLEAQMAAQPGAAPAAASGDAAQPAAVAVGDNSISGISLMLRALWSIIRGWFGGKSG